MKNANLRMLYVCFVIWGLITPFSSVAQVITGTTNFYTNIKSYNLSQLWRADKLRLLELKKDEPFPEPLGVMGKNYQRFYIHYISVMKDPANPYRYHVQGKTRVGNKIRTFTGTITVAQAGIHKSNSASAPESYKGYKRGQLVCKVRLREASGIGAGLINGDLYTDFCINTQNQLFYDTLDFGDEGYQNNQFKGVWLAQEGKAIQNIQYGDFTIMDTEFADPEGIMVPAKYEKYGWQNFVNAISSDLRAASKAAIAEEKRQWWK